MQKNAEWGEFLPVAGVDRAAVFHRETPRVSYVKRLVDQFEMGWFWGAKRPLDGACLLDVDSKKK